MRRDDAEGIVHNTQWNEQSVMGSISGPSAWLFPVASILSAACSLLKLGQAGSPASARAARKTRPRGRGRRRRRLSRWKRHPVHRRVTEG
jgi:hypothetical protein